MTSLKAAYPLYLANEAKQFNTDLAVTDKFTGKVVTRVALADASTLQYFDLRDVIHRVAYHAILDDTVQVRRSRRATSTPLAIPSQTS